MTKNCYFQIPRGNTNRYVYIFKQKGNYYNVTLKVLYQNLPYRVISTVKIPTKNIYTYINTVVASTY
jgi:hypothetical protein